MTDFLAIVLVPVGMTQEEHITWLQGNNIASRKEEFMKKGKLHLPFHVVRDFFDCNQISSLTEIVGNLVSQIMGVLGSVAMTSSNGSAPISEAAIPQTASASSRSNPDT